MSVRYTGEASMDEPALRDLERWKDKIEVRLDNRQVFFLFFGSALCACMLFVLGVIVGKRLESRGRAAAPEVQDPLAVLDRINSVGLASAAGPSKPAEPALTFQKALLGAPARLPAPAPAPRPPVVLAAAAAPRPLPVVAARPPTSTVARVVAAPPAAPPVARTPPAPPAAKLPAVSISRATAAVPAPPKPVAVVTPPKPVAVAAPPKPVAVVAGAAAAPRGRFTLQLSSFPDRSEADALARRFSAQGAYVVTSEIPGKGTWYRVRVGNYGSSQEAIAAKGSFEKQTNTIAYIAGR